MKKIIMSIILVSIFLTVPFGVESFATNSNNYITRETNPTVETPTAPSTTVPLETEPTTTQPETEPITATQPETEPVTQPQTYAPTQAPTQAPTTSTTQPETYYTFETDPVTDDNDSENTSPTSPSSYEVNTDISTENPKKSDWKININDIVNNGSGDDFSKIKNNNSSEDTDTSWLSNIAWVLIGIAIIGIISVIIICNNKSKKIKALNGVNGKVISNNKSKFNKNEQLLIDEDYRENGNKKSSKKNKQNTKNIYIPKNKKDNIDIDKDNYKDNF